LAIEIFDSVPTYIPNSKGPDQYHKFMIRLFDLQSFINNLMVPFFKPQNPHYSFAVVFPLDINLRISQIVMPRAMMTTTINFS